jgi:hypothetical protein
MATSFNEYWDDRQLAIFSGMSSPAMIQAYLDQTPYSAEERDRCPLSVLRDRQAHCLDGALFAAAALRRLGYPPLIVDLLPEPGRDDDHVLAIYKRGRFFGAVAKSNFVGLRFREPVYRTLRELVMSYFEAYFNIDGEKTLRGYTMPLNLVVFDHLDWMRNDDAVDAIVRRLDEMRRVSLLTPDMARGLAPVDKLSYEAGMLGVNLAGLYQPSAQTLRAESEGMPIAEPILPQPPSG